MDLDAIKRRIRALQNMTTERGASEAEAKNAARIMSELLSEHGLTVAGFAAEPRAHRVFRVPTRHGGSAK